MTRKQFKQNLKEALEFHDAELTEEELNMVVNYNFDEDSSIAGWTFADFNSLAVDIATEGLRRACRLNDLYYKGKDDEDEED